MPIAETFFRVERQGGDEPQTVDFYPGDNKAIGDRFDKIGLKRICDALPSGNWEVFIMPRQTPPPDPSAPRPINHGGTG